MKYQDVPRPQIWTGVGVHDSPNKYLNPPDITAHAMALWELGIDSYKLLSDTNDKKACRVQAYREHDIFSIVRIHETRPSPDFVVNRWYIDAYKNAGALAIEPLNEDNLKDEWKEDKWQSSWARWGELAAANWLRNAEVFVSAGLIPVTTTRSPGGHIHHREATLRFLEWIDRLGGKEFLNKAIIGLHVRPLNNPVDTPVGGGNPPNTTTWREHEWFAQTYSAYLGHMPAFACTEDGYSPNSSENGEFPPMTVQKWAEMNRELYSRLNPAHPKVTPAYIYSQNYWIEGTDGAGVWIGDAAFINWLERNAPPDEPLWGKTWREMNINWNRRSMLTGGGGGTQPPIDPPIEPEVPVTRQLVRIPDYIQIVDASVPNGGQYWHLDYAELRTNEFGNNEAHNIFFDEPHDPTKFAVVEYIENGLKSFNIRLEKPAPDPAGDFPIYGADYDAYMDGLPSDRIKGMRMGEPVRRGHQSWWLRFSKKVKEVLVTLAQALIQKGDASQVIRFNPKAALQNAIRNGRDSNNKIIVPNGTEFPLRHEGVDYVGQRAESYLTKEEVAAGILPEVYVYYAKTSNFNDVKRVKK